MPVLKRKWSWPFHLLLYEDYYIHVAVVGLVGELITHYSIISIHFGMDIVNALQ